MPRNCEERQIPWPVWTRDTSFPDWPRDTSQPTSASVNCGCFSGVAKIDAAVLELCSSLGTAALTLDTKLNRFGDGIC